MLQLYTSTKLAVLQIVHKRKFATAETQGQQASTWQFARKAVHHLSEGSDAGAVLYEMQQGQG